MSEFWLFIKLHKKCWCCRIKGEGKNESRHEIFCNGFIWMKICRHSFVARVCLLALNLTQHLTNVILYENLSHMCGNIHNFFLKQGIVNEVQNEIFILMETQSIFNTIYFLISFINSKVPLTQNLIIFIDNMDWDLKWILHDT